MIFNFACIGVGGYIAPRHLHAIKILKHNLILSYDKSNLVGISNKFFPQSLFFNKFSQFKKKFINLKKKINYTVILTPNHTHFDYIKFALSNGSNVICEKPLVLSEHHLKNIQKLEKKYRRKVHTILQLRTLKEVKKLKIKIDKSMHKYDININYITPRGNFYKKSWKGNPKKSGGILFNIGIHLLDLLCYLFGKYTSCTLDKLTNDRATGRIEFSNAKAKFYLSTNKQDLKNFKRKKVVRDFIINNNKIDLVKNNEQAHNDSYREILNKKNFGLSSVKTAIQLAIDLQK
jgi:UDP-N-acetyl-2-amino-2-deoxyglucuronate dehydrogenase